MPEEVADEVRRLAAAAFEALGCEGLARVDCFYTDDGDVVLNEINTMPGFTPHSMYPRMWAASGLDYPELIDELRPARPDRAAPACAEAAAAAGQTASAAAAAARPGGQRPAAAGRTPGSSSGSGP